MREADIPILQAQFSRQPPGIPMQMQPWAPARSIAANLNVNPANIADASADGFGDGFFGRETGSQPNRIVSAIRALAFGEEALQETFAEALYAPGHALAFDHVNAATDHWMLRAYVAFIAWQRQDGTLLRAPVQWHRENSAGQSLLIGTALIWDRFSPKFQWLAPSNCSLCSGNWA